VYDQCNNETIVENEYNIFYKEYNIHQILQNFGLELNASYEDSPQLSLTTKTFESSLLTTKFSASSQTTDYTTKLYESTPSTTSLPQSSFTTNSYESTPSTASLPQSSFTTNSYESSLTTISSNMAWYVKSSHLIIYVNLIVFIFNFIL